MWRILRIITEFRAAKSEAGVTGIEYGLIAALIAPHHHHRGDAVRIQDVSHAYSHRGQTLDRNTGPDIVLA
jgi:hypothetical protein